MRDISSENFIVSTLTQLENTHPILTNIDPTYFFLFVHSNIKVYGGKELNINLGPFNVLFCFLCLLLLSTEFVIFYPIFPDNFSPTTRFNNQYHPIPEITRQPPQIIPQLSIRILLIFVETNLLSAG